MGLISRSEINKKFGRYAYVPVGRFFKQPLPVFCWNGAKPLPCTYSFFRYAKIPSKRFPAPCDNNFSMAFHTNHYGEVLHDCQGEALQCILWINPPHYSS